MVFKSLVFAGLALMGSTLAAEAAPPELVATGDFDFYVLTLSWSPGFCDTGGAEKSREQCAPGAGQGFVVHGLWPENADRPYPSDSGAIPGDALRDTHGLYPSEGLARYEYRKHGTCTGLSPQNYFHAVKYAREKLNVPELLRAPRDSLLLAPRDIENAFIAANPTLTSVNLALTCGRGELIDIRVCVAKSLDGYIDCPKISGHSCHSNQIKVMPLR